MDKLNINWSDIEPLCLIKAISKNAWTIALAAIIGFFSSYLIVDMRYKPEYIGTATFVISSRSANYNSSFDVSTANSTASVFSELVSGDLMRSKISEVTGINPFTGKIESVNDGESNLVTVKVTADSARQAFIIINAIIDNYDSITKNVFQKAVITTLSAPVISKHSTLPMSEAKIELLSAFGAAAAMVVIICYLSISQDTIQNESAAKNKLDAKLLRCIPHCGSYHTLKGAFKNIFRRSLGVKHAEPLITDPLSSFMFSEAIHHIRSGIEQKKHETHGAKNTFLIDSVSPNEGKSMITENIGLSLGIKHKKVLIVDCDLRKPSRYRNNLEKGDWTLLEDYEINNIKINLIYSKKKSLHILYCPESTDKPAELLASDKFLALLADLKKHTNYMLIDSPPLEIFSDGEQLADFADYSMLVVRQDFVPAPMINDAIDVLRSKNAEFMGVLLNNVETLFQNSSAYGSGHRSHGYGYGNYKNYGYGYSNGEYGYNGYGSYGGYGGYGGYGYGDYDKYSRYAYSGYAKYGYATEQSEHSHKEVKD